MSLENRDLQIWLALTVDALENMLVVQGALRLIDGCSPEDQEAWDAATTKGHTVLENLGIAELEAQAESIEDEVEGKWEVKPQDIDVRDNIGFTALEDESE